MGSAFYGSFADSDVVNMISVDMVFLQKALRFAHLPWAFPLQLLLSVSFLYSILGMSILQGEESNVALKMPNLDWHSAPLCFQLMQSKSSTNPDQNSIWEYFEAYFITNLWQFLNFGPVVNQIASDWR